MTDLLRSHGTTATRVYTEYHCLYIVIISQFTQILCRTLTYDTMTTAVQKVHCLTVDNATIGIINSNLLAVFLLLRFYVKHVRERQLVDVVVLVNLQTFLDLCFDLLREKDLVNELGFHIILSVGESHDAIIS